MIDRHHLNPGLPNLYDARELVLACGYHRVRHGVAYAPDGTREPLLVAYARCLAGIERQRRELEVRERRAAFRVIDGGRA